MPVSVTRQCVFAADAVAHPSEQEGAERTDQKARGEQRDRAEQRRDRVAFFEELDRQDSGQAYENIKVVPLDDVTARRGSNHASEVRRNARISHIVLPLVSGTGHQATFTSTPDCRPPAPHRRKWQSTFRSW